MWRGVLPGSMKFKDDEVLGRISSPALGSFASAVGASWVHGGSPVAAFTPFGGEAARDLSAWLQGLEKSGFTGEQIERLIHAVVSGRERDAALAPDLVVSGPDVPGVPTADTMAVVQSLFQEAEREVLIAGYAFHNGQALLQRLAKRAADRPGMRLLFHVDVARRYGDSTSADALILKYAADFHAKHWPWKPSPEIYFDPRALETETEFRASLHAKVVVVDRKKIFLTSANFTGAAQERNIELGVLCALPYLAERVCLYFEGLRRSGALRRLPERE